MILMRSVSLYNKYNFNISNYLMSRSSKDDSNLSMVAHNHPNILDFT